MNPDNSASQSQTRDEQTAKLLHEAMQSRAANEGLQPTSADAHYTLTTVLDPAYSALSAAGMQVQHWHRDWARFALGWYLRFSGPQKFWHPDSPPVRPLQFGIPLEWSDDARARVGKTSAPDPAAGMSCLFTECLFDGHVRDLIIHASPHSGFLDLPAMTIFEATEHGTLMETLFRLYYPDLKEGMSLLCRGITAVTAQALVGKEAQQRAVTDRFHTFFDPSKGWNLYNLEAMFLDPENPLMCEREGRDVFLFRGVSGRLLAVAITSAQPRFKIEFGDVSWTQTKGNPEPFMLQEGDRLHLLG